MKHFILVLMIALGYHGKQHSKLNALHLDYTSYKNKKAVREQKYMDSLAVIGE